MIPLGLELLTKALEAQVTNNAQQSSSNASSSTTTTTHARSQSQTNQEDGAIELECYHVPSEHILQDKYNQKPGRKTMKEIENEQYKDVFQMKTRVSKQLKNGSFLLKNLRLYLHVESGYLYPGISTRDGDLFFPVDKNQLIEILKKIAPDIEDENNQIYHVNVNGKGFKLNGVKYSKQDVVSLIVLIKNSSTNYHDSFKNRERKLILLSPPTYNPRLCDENDPRAIKLQQKIQQEEKSKQNLQKKRERNTISGNIGDDGQPSSSTTTRKKQGNRALHTSSTESSDDDDSEMSNELVMSDFSHPHSPPAIMASQDNALTISEPRKKKSKSNPSLVLVEDKLNEIVSASHSSDSDLQRLIVYLYQHGHISETCVLTYCKNNNLATLEELVEKNSSISSSTSLEGLIESCDSMDKDFLSLMGELMERGLLSWLKGWQHYLRKSYDYALDTDPTIIYRFLNMHRELYGSNPNYKIKDP
ncbi:hypothetical protein C9374_001595 [Naegleria lovaniensis]|uniref:Uncharacterized protein n=1 Tax=Naegleria lovaniensis TaxID=51637 RepID=A0AA88KM43_NAELO|nr:uncharacterized protein C9374_001595 [Naegleria lovaniensis]KAG2387263.1 hypothetical protein C9374_001595 [Naegleria lovaniensis]